MLSSEGSSQWEVSAPSGAAGGPASDCGTEGEDTSKPTKAYSGAAPETISKHGPGWKTCPSFSVANRASRERAVTDSFGQFRVESGLAGDRGRLSGWQDPALGGDA